MIKFRYNIMNKHYYLFTTFIVWLLSGLLAAAQTAYPFQNPALSDDERLDNLISLMSIDEKVNALYIDQGVPRLGIRPIRQSEGLHGLALGGPGKWGGIDGMGNAVSSASYPTTTFPQAYGLGETWDVDLVRRVAEQESHEVRFYTQSPKLNRAGLIMRAPNADLGRDPRWGRTEECYGEDAYLTARMTVAFVKGLQGDNPRYWKTASLMKHFLANSNEDGRDSTSSDFNERLFREYYSYPFYKGITEGGSHAFMASYNAWNNVPMTIHPILQTIARDEWGLRGIICTDGGAYRLLITAHHAFNNFPEGAAAVIKNNVGLFLDHYKPYVYEALRLGLLTEEDIDRAIRGNYYVALRLGQLDGDQTRAPYTEIGVIDTIKPWEQAETKAFVRLVTAKSAVLLKNENKFLPFDKKKIKSIAVIGPLADEVLIDWYSGDPPYTVTILQGIRNAVGPNVKVTYSSYNEMDNATRAAAAADVAIVCVGNHVVGTNPVWKVSPVSSDGREAVDRKALTLEQEDLVKVVLQANPRTALVLVSSFPFAINWSQEHVPAIVHITHNSQELGNGLADVLFGNVNPAGRLTQTWVRDITDLPPMMDYDITNNRTYMYFSGKPLYPFGFGLSYTTFEYSNLKVGDVAADGSVAVSIDVKNSGKLDGDEVVQLYVAFPGSKVERPIKQLKGFNRIFIPKGEKRTVNFTLTSEDLSYWSTKEKRFVVEPGTVKVMLGASSEDIREEYFLKIK
jgi:beta-glucosidase